MSAKSSKRPYESAPPASGPVSAVPTPDAPISSAPVSAAPTPDVVVEPKDTPLKSKSKAKSDSA